MSSGRRYLFYIACMAGPSIVMGQTALQDVEARRDRDRASAPAPLPPRPTIQFTSQRPPSNAEEIRFELADIDLNGAAAFDEPAIRALFEDRLGAETSLTVVFEIAAEIQELYRRSDYIFTRVVVPAQEIDGGVVRLEIIEAVIEAAVIEEPRNPVGPVRDLAARMISPLIGVRNPTGAALERAILNVNEIPGVTRATVVPQAAESGARGGLDLFVNVERDPHDAVIYADNRQTPGIGRGLIGGTYTYNSYTSGGDTTSVSLFNSFAYRSDVTEDGLRDGQGDFNERNTVVLAHQRNLGVDGAVISASALYSRTEPGDDLALVGIQGEQVLGSIAVTYPVLRTRQVDLSAGIGFEILNSETDISNGQFRISDDRLRTVSLNLAGLRRDEIGYTTGEVELRRGLDILNASNPGALELSRADGRSEYTLVRGEVERLVEINESLSFLGRIGGQYAFDALLASEEFAIGGLTYGRGFDPSEHTGDHGIGLSGELRYVTPLSILEEQITMELFGFAEYGVIWNRGDGEPAKEQVASIGGGARFFLPLDYFVSAELAAPMNQPLERIGRNGEQIDKVRLFVNFSKRF